MGVRADIVLDVKRPSGTRESGLTVCNFSAYLYQAWRTARGIKTEICRLVNEVDQTTKALLCLFAGSRLEIMTSLFKNLLSARCSTRIYLLRRIME